MPLFKNKFRTESNRLKDWDYSSEGIYFITIVTQNRECIFGNIDNDKMILNHNGLIIEKELIKSIAIRDNWIFHHWVIMPNHIHLLIEIAPFVVETHHVETHRVETHRSASLQNDLPKKLTRQPNSISSFVAVFKSVVTKQIVDLENYNQMDAPRRDAPRRDALRCVSSGKIWQSNYHDHIVRNYNSFERIHEYISNNPKNWDNDSINLK
jgi:putative transposase